MRDRKGGTIKVFSTSKLLETRVIHADYGQDM